MSEPFPPIDVTPSWVKLNDELIGLVGLVPADRMDWAPRGGLMPFRELFTHFCTAREIWLTRDMREGGQRTIARGAALSPDDLRFALATTWARLERFLSDAQKLNGDYVTPWAPATGHWLAYHALEHDIHHRADLYHYLGTLGITIPEL